MQTPSFLTRRAVVLGGVLAGALGGAHAQDYPTQPIRIIVPYPPGGTTDMISRRFAEILQRELGQAVVIENRGGASTNIGNAAAAAAKPDGYTLLLGANGLVQNPVFGPKPSFNAMQALEPISLIARMPFAVAANPAAPFSNVEQFIAAAKAAPGKYRVSSPQLDVFVELMKVRAGIDVMHVPYKGGGPALMDAVSGQVDMVFALVPVLAPQIQGGKLKGIGVAARQRSEALPAVGTFAEAKVDYEVGAWFGLMAPTGTPKAVIERLGRTTRQIVENREFVQKLQASGAQAVANTPDEFRADMRSEQQQWEKLARDYPHLVQTGN